MDKKKKIKYIDMPQSLVDTTNISKKSTEFIKQYKNLLANNNSDKTLKDINNVKSLLIENDNDEYYDDIYSEGSDVKPSKKQKKMDLVKKIPDAVDLISVNEVRKRMQNYSQVLSKDVGKLVPGVRIQYFEVFPDKNKYLYKPGGILVYNKYPVYVVLSNGIARWSVQLDKNILFEENIDAVKRSYNNIIKDKDKTIEALRNSLKLRIRELNKYKK